VAFKVYGAKNLILYVAKYLGLFYLARIVTANGLRILCYHGFSLGDEHLFRPKLFMTEKLFSRRLEKVAQMGFSVINLNDAVNALKSGRKLRNSLVMTVDDGWQGVETIAAPLFEKYGFPWTLYLTTYYAQKQTQVSNVTIQYLCWKTSCDEVDLSELGENTSAKLSLTDQRNKALLALHLIHLEHELPTAEDRQVFLRRIALLLKVEHEPVERARMFHLLNMTSVKKLHDMGVDIQLHTHRHTMGNGVKEIIMSEITENRRVIRAACENNAQHFCYPSGEYEPEDFSALTSSDVVSATTCKAGLNYSNANPLELFRFLDGENISDIQFEAELSGFSDLLRQVWRKFFASKSVQGLRMSSSDYDLTKNSWKN
jgi:peptidoglycan/xylan/chitin deacetylase (PgdA/CDA1 family)